jgi:putative endonuclease
MNYVYLIKLSNDEIYTGFTKNLEVRINKHNSGDISATANHRPVRLVWYCAFQSEKMALDFEKYLKNASGGAFRNKRLVK